MITDLIHAYVVWATTAIVLPLTFIAGWNWFRASMRA